MIRIPAEKLRLLWVSNYWDHPLEGLCVVRGEVHHFKRTYGSRWCEVTPLTRRQKFRWWLRKTAFEVCVGTHWTYRHGSRAPGGWHLRQPKWFWRQLHRFYYRVNMGKQT